MKARIDKRTLASGATKEKLLDATEPLFAAYGLEGVSVRQIALAADVDLAMISYHFGSKEGLYRAIFRRRAERLNAQRLGELDQVLAESGERPDLERIIHALVAPNMRLRNNPAMGGLPFSRLIVRELTDPQEQQRGIIDENFDALANRFIETLSRTLPHASPKALWWAYSFAIGTLVQAMTSTGRIEKLSGGACKAMNVDDVLDHLVPFIVGGFLGCLDRSNAKAGAAKPVKHKATRQHRRPAAASKPARR
jgi:AcrR family transcriptional regulator